MRLSDARSSIGDLVASAAVVVFAFSVVAVPHPAQARDPDGSRLKANEQQLGSSHDDTINPPEDRADWRYVQIKEAATVRFSLDTRPEETTATLRITRATGEELDSVKTSEGRATVERQLEPGLYYLEVTAHSQISYTLHVE